MDKLLKDVKHSLKTEGYASAREIIDIDEWILPVWNDICLLGELCALRHGIVTLSPRTGLIDEKADWLMQLCMQDRRILSDLYDGIKQLPSFLRLASSKLFVDLYSKLFGVGLVGVGENSYGIRLDLPEEDKFRSHWHQEYAYNPQSPQLVVFWIPLVDMLPNMGSVELLGGSHKLGHIEHKPLPEYSNKTGLYKTGLPLADNYEKEFDKFVPLTKPGDVIILDSRTIHQSGWNRSARLRVTMQVRYFGFNNEQAIKDGWPSRPSDHFGYNVEGKK